MRIIVPIAGPDFELPDGTTRAERVVEGMPLLRRALESRSWWRGGQVKSADLIFILHDAPTSRRFAQERLRSWYPEAATVFLRGYTRGAALTVLGALTLCDSDTPICIDLADILFEYDGDPLTSFRDERLGGLLLTFESSSPVYSYAEQDAQGHVLRTAEKRIISNHASAGVYFFCNAPMLLRAIAHSIENRESLAFDGLLYVCPLYNGIIAEGAIVRTVAVQKPHDIKLIA